jgi:hypothetical protein
LEGSGMVEQFVSHGSRLANDSTPFAAHSVSRRSTSLYHFGADSLADPGLTAIGHRPPPHP